MTRKQALCGIVSRFPEIDFERVSLKQSSYLKSRRHLVEHRYTLSCGIVSGYGKTIQEAFDSLVEILSCKTPGKVVTCNENLKTINDGIYNHIRQETIGDYLRQKGRI